MEERKIRDANFTSTIAGSCGNDVWGGSRTCKSSISAPRKIIYSKISSRGGTGRSVGRSSVPNDRTKEEQPSFSIAETIGRDWNLWRGRPLIRSRRWCRGCLHNESSLWRRDLFLIRDKVNLLFPTASVFSSLDCYLSSWFCLRSRRRRRKRKDVCGVFLVNKWR